MDLISNKITDQPSTKNSNEENSTKTDAENAMLHALCYDLMFQRGLQFCIERLQLNS